MIQLKLVFIQQKNDESALNIYLIVLQSLLILMMSLTILNQILKFMMFHKYNEYRIHQFYGATIMQQICRMALYLLFVFAMKFLLQKYLNASNSLIIDSCIYLVLMILFSHKIIRIYKGEQFL